MTLVKLSNEELWPVLVVAGVASSPDDTEGLYMVREVPDDVLVAYKAASKAFAAAALALAQVMGDGNTWQDMLL